jgi:tubulin-specific chaperone C
LELSIVDLTSKAMPKQKFSFKKKTQATSSAQENSHVLTRGTSVKAISTAESNSSTPQLIASNLDLASREDFVLSSKSHEVIGWDAFLSLNNQDLTICDISSCFINLLQPGAHPAHVDDRATGQQNTSGGREGDRIISAVHVRNLKDTVLVLPDVDGSAMIHDLHHCTIVIGCRQVSRPRG